MSAETVRMSAAVSSRPLGRVRVRVLPRLKLNSRSPGFSYLMRSVVPSSHQRSCLSSGMAPSPVSSTSTSLPSP